VNKKILIVEDNEMNLDMLARRLSRAGFDVVSARTGVGIVERVRQDKPDLVLMDLGLPDVDGFAATAAIRAEPDLQGLPIVALTAHALTTDRERALAVGCDDFATKPVELQGLLERMRRLLEKSQGG
jgi:two-component system cell cycle response regulator DivK